MGPVNPARRRPPRVPPGRRAARVLPVPQQLRAGRQVLRDPVLAAVTKRLGHPRVPDPGPGPFQLLGGEHPRHPDGRGLVKDLPGIAQRVPGAVVGVGRGVGQPGLLGRPQGREDDPVMAGPDDQPAQLRGGQPARSEKPLEVIQPQHAAPGLRRLGDRNRDRLPARRADQHVLRQRGRHRLERRPGLARGRVADQEHEPARGQTLPQPAVHIPGHIGRNVLDRPVPAAGRLGRDGGRGGPMDAQPDRVGDVAHLGHPPVRQHQAPVLGPQPHLIAALGRLPVPVLPDRPDAHHHGRHRRRPGQRPPVLHARRRRDRRGGREQRQPHDNQANPVLPPPTGHFVRPRLCGVRSWLLYSHTLVPPYSSPFL
jgi:hypothetical protein